MPNAGLRVDLTNAVVRHALRYGRALPGKQKPVFIYGALQTARRYVVLASGRGIVWLRFSGKPFSHTLPPRLLAAQALV